jgi:hypothetical protein
MPHCARRLVIDEVDNEFYVVLRNRPDLVQAISPEEVARRWLRLSRWSLVLKPEPTAEQIKEELAKPGRLEELRRRLSSISWHMIMLKEPIARAANKEDGVRGHFFAERFDAVKLEDGEQRLATSLQINSLAVRLGLASDLANSRFTAAYARLHGDGDWLADELIADGSQSSNESPASEDAAAAEASGAGDANGSAEAGDAEKVSDASEAGGSTETERVAGEAVDSDVVAAVDGDSAKLAKKTPLFNRLPLDVYLDWLASSLVGLSSDDPELETPALRLPKQLPAAWLRYGLNAANWKEAVRTISRRFRWLERTASEMRRDCRRFVADSGPPPG